MDYQSPIYQLKNKQLWRDWYLDGVRTIDIETAYKRLKSHFKFNNYVYNYTPWESGSLVTYHNNEFNGGYSDEIIDSCIAANHAINKMMEPEGVTNG